MKELKRLIPVIGITLVVMLISLLLYNVIMKQEKEQAWLQLNSTAQAINREITTKIQDEIVKLHLIEEIMLQEDIFDERDIGLLHLDLVQTATIFSRVDILFSDGTLITDGQKKIVQKEIDFAEVAARGEHISARKTDSKTGKEGVYYILPVMKENNTIALIIALMDSARLAEAFLPIYYNGQINICMIDIQDGNYIMDTWHKELGNAYQMGERETLKDYEDVDIYEEFRNFKTGAIAFVSRSTGKPLYMYYTPVNMFEWQLTIFAQEDVLFGNLLSLRKVFLLAGAIEALLLVLYFAWNIGTVRLLEKGNEEIRRQKEELKYISYWDMLTSMYNRNKYTEVLETFRGQNMQNAGVAYIDLNGLKQVNDTQSHEAGDRYIKNTAKIISDVFAKRCYRIGGDEFVVIVAGMEQTEFQDKIKLLQERMESAHISIAIGVMWNEQSESLEGLLKEAEKEMYADKEQYYQTHSRGR